MIFINDINTLKLDNTIVMIGKFDGMHLGHQKLLNRAVEIKHEHSADNLSLVLFTFNIIPASFNGAAPERRIITSDEIHRARINSEIDYLIECPFTDKIKSLTPYQFADEILSRRLNAKYVIAGDDFRFGINRSGNTDSLRAFGSEFGFSAEILPKMIYKDREISSSYIREMITEGNMEAAAAMLGKPYFISSHVVTGKKLGKTIGFPTINFVIPDNKIIPKEGVYATRTVIDHELYYSITNIGSQPSFDMAQHNYAETHIMDFDRDIYGREVKVKFYHFIRPVMKFNSLDELASEISSNILEVKDYFNSDIKIPD